MEVIIDVDIDDAEEREVSLEGGPPWGFRMNADGDDADKELLITRVNPGSKASLRGVREGDFITSINGRPTKEITNSQAHTLLKSAGDRLILGLNEDCQNSPKRRQYKTILHHHHQEVVHETSKTSSSTSHTTLFAADDRKSPNSARRKAATPAGDEEDALDGAPWTNGKLAFDIQGGLEEKRLTGGRGTNGLVRTDTNPFRRASNDQKQSIDSDYDNIERELELEREQAQEQQEVDETPCVSTATPTPTSSQYSSDTRGLQREEASDICDMPQGRRNKRRKNKNGTKAAPPANVCKEPRKSDKNRLRQIEIEEIATSSISNSSSGENLLNYRVDSPKLLRKEGAAKSPLAKSKSLDNLDAGEIKITEVKSGDELSDDDIALACNEALISELSEADSDVDWEVTTDLDIDDSLARNSSKLSTQEEEQLRYFIDKLNLPGATGARVEQDALQDESRRKVARSSSAIRQKRNEQRQLLQYFAPLYDNARFLEAITEENTEPDGSKGKSKSRDKSRHGSEEVVNVSIDTNVIERGEVEVVVLESSSGDDEEEDDEFQEEEQSTPPPTPEKVLASDEPLKEEQKEENTKDTRQKAEEASAKEFIEEIIKDIVIEEEIEESTKNVQTFAISVKKVYEKPKENPEPTAEISPRSESPETQLNDEEIAVVEQKIAQTELNIAHDQELINQLQNSLEKDQKEIQEAQEEIEHMKSLEKEFKEVLRQRQSFSPQRKSKSKSKSKERSTSRSSDSSNSSIGTTVVLNPSLKDMAAITAEAEKAEREQLQATKEDTKEENVEESVNMPLTLKESCLKRLVDLPFGPDALEELASVSKSLKEFTDSLPKVAFSLIKSKSSKSFGSQVLTKNIVTETTTAKEQEVTNEIIDDDDGFTVVSTTTNEERKHTVDECETVRNEVTVQNVVDISGSRKLLDIVIQEKLNNPEEFSNTTDKAHEVVDLEELQRLHEARLHAKDKHEWLELVRTGKLPAVPKRGHPQAAATAENGAARAPPARPPRRRRSLPPELHVKQMQYLIEKEKHIQTQLDHLEAEKRQLLNQMLSTPTGPSAANAKDRPKSLPPHEELRQRMYEEYQRQLAEREERRSQQVIKISLKEDDEVCSPTKAADFNCIEREFMDIVKERKKQQQASRESSAETSDKDNTVLVLDGVELRAKKVPKHLQEFLASTLPCRNGDGGDVHTDDEREEAEEASVASECSGSVGENGDGIWSPGQKSSFDRTELQRESTQVTSQESLRSNEDPCLAPIWTPKSAGSSPIAERKEFRPVSFESPTLPRKSRTKSDGSANAEPPWNKDQLNSSVDENKLPTSQSAPGPGFNGDFTPRLPRAQNPTITLLQKAREGQIPPKSAAYIEQDRNRRRHESPYNSQNDLIYNLRTESISDSDSERPKRTVYQQVRQSYDGVGPTTTHGMPVGLRSEIRDANMSQWYKRMYDTIHKHRPSKYDDDEYVTIRYKQRNRVRQPFATGYLSEPEAGAYDSDVALSDDKYATLDRRRGHPYGGSSANVDQRPQSVYNRYASYSTSTLPNSGSKQLKTAPKSIKHHEQKDNAQNTTTIRYKPEVQLTNSALSLNKPGKIEHYTPGKSSISESEAKKWWDEVMDIFDGMEKQQQQQRQKVPLVQPKGYLSQALKESGYESDSTLVFRRRDETAQQLSPLEQRAVYKNIQKGGDVPLHGLRKVAPERPKEEEIVYFPQYRSLRAHRSAESRMRSRSSSKEKPIVCYPILTTFDNDTFAAYKRTAPSGLHKSGKTVELTETKRRIGGKPPSPPRRKSSRNNSTLRMIHSGKTSKTMTATSPMSSASAGTRRHETCFSPTPKAAIANNVKNLRDKITTKLSPVLGGNRKVVPKTDKKLPRTPLVKCYCTRSRPCGKCTEPKEKVKSPVEVKKAVMNQICAMNGNTSSAILAKINGSRKPPTKTSRASVNTKKVASTSPAPSPISIASSRSTLKSTSLDSLPKSIKSSKVLKVKPKTITKSATSKTPGKDDLGKKLLKKTKSKKELLNTQVKSSSMSSQDIKTVEKPAYVPKPAELLSQQPDGFFQQLFFGPNYYPKKTCEVAPFISTAASRISQETRRICDPTLGALKRYLSHTKPVSESRFKYLDMVRSRSSSPKSIQWHSDAAHERSISLPPKLIFTQTSRPVTPTFERKKLSVFREPEMSPQHAEPRIERLIFSQTSRPVSPVIRRTPTPSSIDGSWVSSRCPSPSETLYFTETSRPVSPVVMQRPPPLPQRPISPVYCPPESPRIRSPSYRRIKQIRSRPHSIDGEVLTNRSQRFKDLNKFYQDLERVGQLERTASSCDLRPRRKFEEEIIDYDRWQEVRQRERAERELSSLYRQLKHTQEEHDFLFKAKPLSKWRRNLDRGLRIKERSVENLRDEFERIRKDQLEEERKLKEELNVKRGVYKSLWRGNSVVNLAHTLNTNQRSQSESRASVLQRICDNEKLLTHGLGSRIWSSLSMEQVNILKNQLTEIYGSDTRFSKKNVKPALSLPRQNMIDVSLERTKPPKELRVRRNSDTTPPKVVRHVEKSKSATMVGKIMSEDEKKKLSQSLSKEVLNLHFRNKSDNVIKAKETLGAVAAANAHITETPPPRTSYEDGQRKDFLLALSKPANAQIKTDCVNVKQPKSETESTNSTDGSTKTVIYKDLNDEKLQVKKEKIQEKVTYFENKDKEEYTPTIYKPSDEPVDDFTDFLFKSSLPRSQSNQDFRELFGESQLNRMATEPLSASRKAKYTRPHSPILRSSFYRTRSLSPDAQYPRSAIKVTDLKNKFEQYYNQRFALPPRRCSSDPQLSKLFHEGEKVTELRSRFEYPKITGRGRSRVRKTGLISSAYLRAEDRYMPHINIISKIATLYPKTHRKETSRSSENLAKILGIPVGEVHKLRERFDAADKQMSILGHMFTSSPNINELRDVAQYLTGNWYAHKHPKAEEGDVVPRVLKRPKSASPPRQKSKLASILKLPSRRRAGTATAAGTLKQSKSDDHSIIAPFRSWWTPAGKHSVHFKEPEGPPPPAPPPSVEHDQVSSERSEMREERTMRQALEIKTDVDPESPRKYVENEVTIHYRTPVRQEVKEAVDEHELARRQADAMRKIYEEERHRKHLQVSSYSDNELQDRRSRRHTDNFIPSQKSPIPLNRYDDFIDEMSSRMKLRPRSPEPRLVARALYNFVGQSARELTFKKGDVIYVRRQIDKNWYEGELNAMIGLFPANYVEIVPYDGVKTTTRKPNEGQARAKYNFIAQSHLELSLAKGELVVVTRRVDDNWYEGRISGRKGIFPVSYVEMLVDPHEGVSPVATKPVASPAAHSMLLNGSSGGKESMGTHNYVPTFPTQDLGMSYRAKPVQITDAGTYGSLKKNPIDQALHIDIQNDPVPYRALYKYRPQNEDELELLEGDVVQVLEKCDDGWFVGTSERTGAFGTFPGNYVEKIA